MRSLFLISSLLFFMGCGCGPSSPDKNTVVEPVSEPIKRQAYLEIRPETSLADEMVTIRIGGLPPGQLVTIKAAMEDDRGRMWRSQARFEADALGMVDLSAQAPLSGNYLGIDPMGLFWSMKPLDPANEFAIFANEGTGSVPVTFVAEVDQEEILSQTIHRVRLRENIDSMVLEENGLVGRFYVPQEGGPFPTIIVLGGSGGGVSPGPAVMLASRGYATLALAYFGDPPLPEELSGIPLEYFGRALHWLKNQEQVDENNIGVIGISRGGELALLLGTIYPEIRVVVGYVPSGVVFRNLPRSAGGETSAWLQGGTPVPYANNYGAATLARAAIPVEQINGPILLISGKDDQLWPSTLLSEIAIKRLEENNHPYPYKHLVYDEAGHLIGLPYWPKTTTGVIHPITGDEIVFGGSARGNAAASADAWPRVLHFLDSHLK